VENLPCRQRHGDPGTRRDNVLQFRTMNTQRTVCDIPVDLSSSARRHPMAVNVPQPAIFSQETLAFTHTHTRPQRAGVGAQRIHGRTHVAALGYHVPDITHGLLQDVTALYNERWSPRRRVWIQSMCSREQPTTGYRMQDSARPSQRAGQVGHRQTGSDQKQIAVLGKVVEHACAPGITHKERTAPQPVWRPGGSGGIRPGRQHHGVGVHLGAIAQSNREPAGVPSHRDGAVMDPSHAITACSFEGTGEVTSEQFSRNEILGARLWYAVFSKPGHEICRLGSSDTELARRNVEKVTRIRGAVGNSRPGAPIGVDHRQMKRPEDIAPQ
jgi:hypothetical protein